MDGHDMSYAAKWKVGTPFLNNPTGEEIWLHMDQGKMGGGEQVQHCDGDTITLDNRGGDHDDFGDYYDDDFNNARKSRFHYCLMADRVKHNGDYVGGTANDPHDGHFTVADGEWDNKAETGSSFMHELGHVLGLTKGSENFGSGYFPGIDNESYSFDKYPSVMNYNAPDDYYKYSDGSKGVDDHNDWEDILTEMDDYL